jgi:tripartite-type tricarboxylate transporter receptor subunit TctC
MKIAIVAPCPVPYVVGGAEKLWWGLAAPGKTPAPVIAFLNKHLNDTINSASFRGRMEPLGMTIPADNTPEKFAAYMRTEMARQAELAKLSGHAPMEPKR